MIAKLKAVLNVFRRGERVADPAVFHNSIALAGALTALLVSLKDLSATFGFETGLSNVQLESLAQGAVTALGVWTTVAIAASSRRVGLPGKTEE
jgi:hypothetical protein